MLMEHIVPQPEVIRAILLEGSPVLWGAPAPGHVDHDRGAGLACPAVGETVI